MKYECPLPWTVIEYGEEEGKTVTLGVTHFETRKDAEQHIKWVRGLARYSCTMRLFRSTSKLVRTLEKKT